MLQTFLFTPQIIVQAVTLLLHPLKFQINPATACTIIPQLPRSSEVDDMIDTFEYSHPQASRTDAHPISYGILYRRGIFISENTGSMAR